MVAAAHARCARGARGKSGRRCLPSAAIRVPSDARHVFPVTNPQAATGRLEIRRHRMKHTLQAQPGGPRAASPPAASPCWPPAARRHPARRRLRRGSRRRAETRPSSSRRSALKIPAMKGLSEGVKALRREQGLRGHRPGPQPRPAEAGHRPAERHRVRQGRRRLGDRDRTPPSMTALVETAQDEGGPADPQRHPRGLRPRRPAARPLVLHHRLRGPGQGASARSSATASTRSSTARPR